MTTGGKPGRRAEDRNYLLQPARRIYVAALFVLLCAAIAISYFYLQSNFKDLARSACRRANAVRIESNHRIKSHIKDEQNLLRLLRVTTNTRRGEARAWEGIYAIIQKGPGQNTPQAKEFDQDITNLITTLKQAAKEDNLIRASEQTITFDKLILVHCSNVTN